MMLQTLASLPKVIEQKTIGGRRLPVTAAVVVDGGGTELWGVLGLRGDRRNLRFWNYTENFRLLFDSAMENRDLHPMTILKLKRIHNCKKCYRKLQKKLLEVDGVHGVSIDEVNKMVSVRGKADPWVLIKAIEENGNSAELLSYEKDPNRKNYSESSSTVSETENVQKNGREKKSYSFWRGNKDKKSNSFKSKKEKQEEEEEHKIEDYVPLKIDPEVCRDPFCKVHKRRPVITSRVPSRDNENHPHHTGMGGVFPGAYQLFHQTNPYGFRYRDNNGPEMLAPPHGGFYSRRPAAPYGFTFHGNGNPGNCTTM